MDDLFARHRDIARAELKRKYRDFDAQLKKWKRQIKSRCRKSNPISAALKMRKKYNLEGDNALWLILATCEIMEERKKGR